MTYRIIEGLEDQIVESLLEKAEYAAKYDTHLAAKVFSQYLDAYYRDYTQKFLTPPFPDTYLIHLSEPPYTAYVRINITPSIRYLLFVRTIEKVIFNFNAYNTLPHGFSV